jgi:hypothetical protein
MKLEGFAALVVAGALFCPAAAQLLPPSKLSAAPKISSSTLIEHRLRSIHPALQNKPGKAVPGRYLLGRAEARRQRLAQRSQSTQRPRAEIAHLQTSGSSAPYPGIQLRPMLPAGLLANSVATGDFNGDGHMDFVVANGGSNDLWLYLGKGDGTFQLPQIVPLTKGWTPTYIVAADLRNKGILDLVVAEYDSSTIGVLLGNGDGTFAPEQEYSLPLPAGALTIADFNRDGKPDIAAVLLWEGTYVAANGQFPYLALFTGDGQGNFGTPVITYTGGESSATSLSAGDVNGDGLPDLLVTDVGSQVFLNSGSGTFTAGMTLPFGGTLSAVSAGVLADVNGDGCLDAIASDMNTAAWIGYGDCHGNFTVDSSAPWIWMGAANSNVIVADVNGDGFPDIITTSFPEFFAPAYDSGNSINVALNDGHGHFGNVRNYTGAESYSLAIADFNGDGKPDVVSVSAAEDAAVVYMNLGNADFGFPEGEWIGYPDSFNQAAINLYMTTPTFADLNGDGIPDIFYVSSGLTSLLNDGLGHFSPQISSALTLNSGTYLGDYRLGDFRNTGKQDFLAVAMDHNADFSNGSMFIAFAPGNGDGTFGATTITNLAGADGGLVVGDFNHDGKLDFVAVSTGVNGGWLLTCFLGNGNGTFRTAGTLSISDSAENITRIYTGDFNRDGKLDVLMYTTANSDSGPSSVWEILGNGDGTFRPAKQLYTGFDIFELADLNGDSWLDLIRYDGSVVDGSYTIFLGQPDGTFAQHASYIPYSQNLVYPQPFLQQGDPSHPAAVSQMARSGETDLIDFQFGTHPADISAQILAGNGDGTFTPTYDVFPLSWNAVSPAYSYKLDGSGLSNLLELDTGTASMRVYKAAPAPALQIALEQEQYSGTEGCGWIFPNVPGTSDRSIALASSVLGIELPSSVILPAGALSTRFCFTFGTGFDRFNVFDISAQLNGDTAVAYASHEYDLGFTEALSPASIEFYQPGNSAPITVTLQPDAGYNNVVTLGCLGLPSNIRCSFNPPSVQLTSQTPATSQLTLVVPVSIYGNNGQATDEITVLATDGKINVRQQLQATITNLQVLLNGFSIASPGTSAVSFQVYGLAPYTFSCAGLPAGASCSVSGTPVSGWGYSTLTLTVTLPEGVPSGNYYFSLTANSGSVSGYATANCSVTEIPLPTITGLVPATVAVGIGAFTLTVNGSNFSAGQSVMWNQTALATTFVNSSQLTALVPASQLQSPGAIWITVSGNDLVSAPEQFVVTPDSVLPLVLSLSPATVTTGGTAFALTVNGGNFTSQSQVLWNGLARKTTFVSISQLTATITSADIATDATAQITVATPGKSAATSSAQPLLVISKTPTSSIRSITVANTVGQSSFLFTVTGTNYLPGSVVLLNGYYSLPANMQTWYVSPWQLTGLGYHPNDDGYPVTVATPSGSTVTISNAMLLP